MSKILFLRLDGPRLGGSAIVFLIALTVLSRPTKVHAATASEGLPAVTVIAPKPPDASEIANASVPEFISAHARPAVVTGQLSRWRDGVCPATMGPSPGFNTFISARIVAIARSVGAPQTTERCKPNVRIFFTTEPEKLIQEIEKRDPILLGFHYSQQTKQMTTFSHPIQGWYVTATQGDNGATEIDNPMPIQLANTAPAGSTQAAMQAGKTPAGRLGSHITTGLSSLIVNVIIIADTRKVAGYTAGSISDYLAMLVLSQTKSPATCGQLPSILDLMTSQCDSEKKPDSVTAGDLAFLHALYKTNLREGSSLEQSSIRNMMMQEFSAALQ